MKFTTLKIQVVCLLFFSVVCTYVFAERKLSKEAIIFRATRDAVFTVYGGSGHGSGFLVDRAGLILTNSHVISSPKRISVQIADDVRVQATLLAEDKHKDIAVLHVNSEVVKKLPILKRADRPTANLAFEGEKVIAIGSPLNQIRILTSGIISKMEKHVIISDVNINPGNSGGPMINMDSEVIAINTFRDPSPGGSGISGSIPITIANPILAKARNRLNSSNPPSSKLLPIVSKDGFPIEGLKWVSKQSSINDNYIIKQMLPVYKGPDYYLYDPGFYIWISTPPRDYFLEMDSTKQLAQKRRNRERAAGIPHSEMYDPVGSILKEWQVYVGKYAPLVTIHVWPKVDQTAGSVLSNLFIGSAAEYYGIPYSGSYTYEFVSDLQDFELIDGESTVPEVFRGMGIIPVSTSVGAAKMNDIAQRGFLKFRPEVFKIPDLHLRIWDLKNPNRIIKVPIPPKCREQILMDFEPYFDKLNAKNAKLVLPRRKK